MIGSRRSLKIITHIRKMKVTMRKIKRRGKDYLSRLRQAQDPFYIVIVREYRAFDI